jgi:hypothetical protein
MMFFVLLQTQAWCSDCGEWVSVNNTLHIPSKPRRVRTMRAVDGRSDRDIFNETVRKTIEANNSVVAHFTEAFDFAVKATTAIINSYADVMSGLYAPKKRVGISAQRSTYGPSRPEKAPKGLTADHSNVKRRR